MTKKDKTQRWILYFAGLLILAMGLTLNTKAGLGVSPIISVAYATSQITGYNFGNTTLAVYILFVIIEMILHTIRLGKSAKRALLMDFLQIPLSIVFTRFLNLFSAFIPDIEQGNKSTVATFLVQLLVLAIALILTGIGAALSLDMRIIPNPGDGIVQAIADFTHKSVGLIKNCVDVTCVTTTVILSLSVSGRLYGIGIGTIIAMIAVGRIIALFNYITHLSERY